VVRINQGHTERGLGVVLSNTGNGLGVVLSITECGFMTFRVAIPF